MDEALRVLEQTESLLTQAESNLKKLEAMKLGGIDERIRDVFNRIEALESLIRGQLHTTVKRLAQLTDKIGRREYRIDGKIYTAGYSYVVVRKNPKSRKEEHFTFWEFVDSSEHWSYKFLYEMTAAIGEYLTRCPQEQALPAEEIDELLKLGEEFVELSK